MPTPTKAGVPWSFSVVLHGNKSAPYFDKSTDRHCALRGRPPFPQLSRELDSYFLYLLGSPLHLVLGEEVGVRHGDSLGEIIEVIAEDACQCRRVIGQPVRFLHIRRSHEAQPVQNLTLGLTPSEDAVWAANGVRHSLKFDELQGAVPITRPPESNRVVPDTGRVHRHLCLSGTHPAGAEQSAMCKRWTRRESNSGPREDLNQALRACPEIVLRRLPALASGIRQGRNGLDDRVILHQFRVLLTTAAPGTPLRPRTLCFTPAALPGHLGRPTQLGCRPEGGSEAGADVVVRFSVFARFLRGLGRPRHAPNSSLSHVETVSGP